MSLRVAPVRLAVLGPPNLLVTSLVAGMGTRGVDAERLPPHEARGGTGSFPRPGPGVLLVDVDGHHLVSVIPGAIQAEWVVLVIGSEANRDRAAAAIAAGAIAWIRTTSSIDVPADTVRDAAAGRMRMSDEKRAEWLAEHRNTSDSVRADLERIKQLSPREWEVLSHLADGLRAAEISGLLFVSITTVRSHIRSILVKLGVNSQQRAADVHRELSRRLGRNLGTGPGR